MRAHYLAPVQSPAGALQGSTTISVFAPGSTQGGTAQGTLITGTVYADATSGSAMTNPFISTTGVIDFYLLWPQRVDLGVQVPGQAQVFYPAIDVNVPNLVPVTVTANYAVQLSDQLVYASAAGGNVSLTLPPATAGVQITFKRTDSSGNSMSVNAQSGQQIEAASLYPLPVLGRARVHSDGTAWWVI